MSSLQHIDRQRKHCGESRSRHGPRQRRLQFALVRAVQATGPYVQGKRQLRDVLTARRAVGLTTSVLWPPTASLILSMCFPVGLASAIVLLIRAYCSLPASPGRRRSSARFLPQPIEHLRMRIDEQDVARNGGVLEKNAAGPSWRLHNHGLILSSANHGRVRAPNRRTRSEDRQS